jgi:hypothetical protein
MRRASFITTEDRDKDLIVSFALEIEDAPGEIESLILLRTPIYESLLYPQERGVSVSLEGEPEEDEANCMTALHLTGSMLRIETRHGQSYAVDISKVRPRELEAAKRLLQKMNFDNSFELAGMD